MGELTAGNLARTMVLRCLYYAEDVTDVFGQYRVRHHRLLAEVVHDAKHGVTAGERYPTLHRDTSLRVDEEQ